MRILMYRWKAYNQFDIIQNLEKRGHIVDEIEGEMANFEEDDYFLQQFQNALNGQSYDLVITVNYFPIISNECQRRNIRYVSWCCDSPISTMYNESVFNEVNTIFTFDKWNQIEFEDKGKNTLPGVVSKVTEDEVEVGFNHPLAGQPLLFKVQIFKVTPPGQVGVQLM